MNKRHPSIVVVPLSIPWIGMHQLLDRESNPNSSKFNYESCEKPLDTGDIKP